LTSAPKLSSLPCSPSLLRLTSCSRPRSRSNTNASEKNPFRSLRTSVTSFDSNPTKRPSPEIELTKLWPVNVSVGRLVLMPSVLPVLRSRTKTSCLVAIAGDEVAGGRVPGDEAAVRADDDVERAAVGEITIVGNIRSLAGAGEPVAPRDDPGTV